MYTIKIAVKGDGTLVFEDKPRLRLGTADECKRIKLIFEMDETIEGSYQYIKLVNGNLACLFRVTSKEIVLSKTIQSKSGVWLLSFISTDGVIENGKITGDYAYISEPVEAVVIDGILNTGHMSEELYILDQLVSMKFEELVIPEGVTQIGEYFLYNSKKTFSVVVGIDVKSIGTYAFYGATILKLSFAENCRISELCESAFYNITFESDIVLPNTITKWGKYVFQHSSSPSLRFKEGCYLSSMGSYALWENDIQEIYLPDHLQTLSGNTYVIKNCTSLKKLWIPNTLTSLIPYNAIYGCTNLKEIELQSDFNVQADFSNCTALTAESLEKMLLALKNLNGSASKTLTLGSTNLAKLNDSQKAIATNKNWKLS